MHITSSPETRNMPRREITVERAAIGNNGYGVTLEASTRRMAGRPGKDGRRFFVVLTPEEVLRAALALPVVHLTHGLQPEVAGQLLVDLRLAREGLLAKSEDLARHHGPHGS